MKTFKLDNWLPTTKKEVEARGWDYLDVILFSGDAYVDHPSFGMAVIGRVLEAQGFRVGIIAQPDWTSAEAFKALGKPNLFWGVTAGNMDSMVNRYTSDRKIRSDDAYTPNAELGMDYNSVSAIIRPYCKDSAGVLVQNVTLAVYRIEIDGSFTETMRNSNSDTSVVQICHELQNGLIVLECDSQLATFQITENGLIENKRVQPVASGSGRLLSYALDNTAISFDYSNVLHKTIFSLESITTIEIGTLAHIDYFSPPSLNPTHSSLFAIPALDQNLFSLYSIAGNQLQKINPIIQQYEGP